MDDRLTLSSVLRAHVDASGVSLQRLARAAGIPVATLHHWLSGRVERPYHVEGVLRVARVLELSRARANRLLRAAGYPPLDALLAGPLAREMAEVLSAWDVSTRHNLPAELTSFVGRAAEIDDLTDLLARPDVRLVTLTGPGGSGKTRLAIRVARDLLDVFRDGVYCVDLAPISTPANVVPAILRTLNVRDVRDEPPVERLIASLGARRVLLLLDNFEQVIAAGPDIAAILRGAPNVTALVTSRTPLRVSGEHERTLVPFAVPTTRTDLAALSENPAIRLFVDRASAVNPSISLTGETADAIREIGVWLDGLPLAIELAAARCRELSPLALRESFRQRLDLADDGPVDLPARQQGLRAAIDWSRELLLPREQRLLARLSVFPGGWTEESAADVCAAANEPPWDITSSLRVLREASLISTRSASTGAHRFVMLETIREYASERLAASGEAMDVQRRLAEYIQASLQPDEPYLPLPRRRDWLERIEREYPNVQAALTWATAHDDALAASIAATIWPYWREYALLFEGRAWLDPLLTRQHSIEPRQRAHLLTASFLFGLAQADYQRAMPEGDTALRLWDMLGDHHYQALVLQQQAWAAYTRADIPTALALTGDSLEQWRAIDARAGYARSLNDLAFFHISWARLDLAQAPLEEARRLYIEVGDELGIARLLADQGLGAIFAGDLSGAITMLQDSVERARPFGLTFILPSALFYLGTALCLSERPAEALVPLREALILRYDAADILGWSMTLLAFAAVAHRQNQPERAARLCGAVTEILGQTGIVMAPATQMLYEREVAMVIAKLGSQAAFDAHAATGSELSIDDAVAYALGEC